MVEARIARRSGWQVLAVLMLWMLFVWYGFLRHRSAPMYDFLPTYAAGKIIADQELAAGLYTRDATQFNTVTTGPIFDVSQVVTPLITPTPFVYPPVYAWLMKPVANLKYEAAKLVLLLLSTTSFALGMVALLLTGARQQGVLWTLAVVALFCIWFQPINYSSWLGQITTLVFGLICLSLFCVVRERQWCAGILLGAALSVKLFPLGVLLFLGASRRLRAVAAALATWIGVLLISAMLSGVQLVLDYIESVRGIAAAGSLAVWNNQSVTAFLLRFSASWDSILRWYFLEVPAWIWVVALASVLFFMIWSLRLMSRYSRSGAVSEAIAADRVSTWNEVGLIYSQGIMLSLVLTPVVWNHYEVVAIVPAFWIANRLYCERSRLDLMVWVALLGSAWVLMALDTSWIAYAISDGRGRQEVAGFLALPVSANLCGVVLLFGLLNRLAGKLRRDCPESATNRPFNT